MKIGDYIKIKREENKLLQAQLAEKADVSQTNLSHLERYNRMPKFDVICRLCDALDITPTELWTNIIDEYGKKEGVIIKQVPIPTREEGGDANNV